MKIMFFLLQKISPNLPNIPGRCGMGTYSGIRIIRCPESPGTFRQRLAGCGAAMKEGDSAEPWFWVAARDHTALS